MNKADTPNAGEYAAAGVSVTAITISGRWGRVSGSFPRTIADLCGSAKSPSEAISYRKLDRRL